MDDVSSRKATQWKLPKPTPGFPVEKPYFTARGEAEAPNRIMAHAIGLRTSTKMRADEIGTIVVPKCNQAPPTTLCVISRHVQVSHLRQGLRATIAAHVVVEMKRAQCRRCIFQQNVLPVVASSR